MAKKTGRDWRAEVKGLLKAELKRHDVTYADLAARLSALGIDENERNVSNKISRGTFTAIFLIQCLHAVGSKVVQVPE